LNELNHVQAQPYDEQMLALMDTQLNFEQLERRAESNPHLFPTDTKLATNLESIGKYLNKILSEYADEFSKFSGEPPTQKLNHLTDNFVRWLGDPREKLELPVQCSIH
jgi:hypothetical protein